MRGGLDRRGWGVLATVVMLVAATGCGTDSQGSLPAPPAGSPAPSCGPAGALHEDQLHDDATVCTTVGTSLVGRLETSASVPSADPGPRLERRDDGRCREWVRCPTLAPVKSCD